MKASIKIIILFWVVFGYTSLTAQNCLISSITAAPGACSNTNNSYTLTGLVYFINAPLTGTLIISVSGGNSVTLSAPFTTSVSYSISNLNADGMSHTVTATFSDDILCTNTQSYTAPVQCATPCPPSNFSFCTSDTYTLTAPAGYNSYQWYTVVGMTETPIPGAMSNVYIATMPGTYIYRAIDDGTCAIDLCCPVTLNDVRPLLSCTGTVTPSCGQSNGSATVSAVGGAGGYTYRWGTSPQQTSATATNLAAGTYIVTVTDSGGCSNTCQVVLTPPNSLTCLASVLSNPGCGLMNGSATVAPSGGNGIYTYLWSTTPIQEAQTAVGLSAGIYTVTVTDGNMCSNTCNVILNATNVLTCNTSVNTEPTCANITGGSATVNGSGGSGSYTYSWSNGMSGAMVSELAAGNYTVTVTDATSGCSNTCTTQIINSISSINVTCTPMSNTECVNHNGSISLNTNATNPIYLWSNGITTQHLTGLNGGTYTVTVTDGITGCSNTCAAIVVNNVPTNVTCCTQSETFTLSGNATLHNGYIRLTPFSANRRGQAWSPFAINLHNNFRQEFSVFLGTIIGQQGGDGLAFVFNGHPTQLLGSIGAGLGYGGISPSLAFEFDTYRNADDPASDHFALHRNGNAQTSGRIGNNVNLSNLSNGNWHDVIIDWNAATQTITVTFNGTVILSLVRDIVALDFNGNPLVKFGFTASTGDSFNEHGVCVNSLTYTPCNIDDIVADFSTLTTGCATSANSAQVVMESVEGAGRIGYSLGTTYSGGPFENSALITESPYIVASGLPVSSTEQFYTIRLYCDENTYKDFVVNITPGPTCSATANTQPTCANLSGGSATVSGSGGSGSYNYAWSNGMSGAMVSGLEGGTYTVTVTDSNNCQSTCQVTIDTPQNCCNISVISQTSVCDDNGTPSKATDNRIQTTVLVSNENNILTTYTISIGQGTSITPTSGTYGSPQTITLGPGTAGGGATFTVTFTDVVNGSGCIQTLEIIDPGNCASSNPLPPCPTPKCGEAVIQVNGN